MDKPTYEHLSKEVERLRYQLTIAQRNNHRRNLELDAMHYIWCNGGCNGGAHRWTENNITQELVDLAKLNIKRLEQWWNNYKRKELKEPTDG